MVDEENGAVPAQAADHIADELRLRITAGELPPGSPLRDATLATEFDVSRNTVREALRVLRYSGLVRHQLYRGVEVAALSVSDVRDIYAARRSLEVRAVQESGVAPERALAAVGDAVAAAERALEEQAWREVGTASLAFHQALVALLGSPSLDGFMATLVARLRLAFAAMEDEEAFQSPWVPRDRQIHDLIAEGERGRAEEALRVYLADSERNVIDVVRKYHAEREHGRPSSPHEDRS